MFRKMTKSKLQNIGDRIIALERKKTRLLDILFEEDELLICEVECGEQDCGSGHSSCDKWRVTYNRETKKFAEA